MAEQTQIDELKQKMREERDRLLATLERIPDAEASKPTTGEGEWSAKQQISHLCEMETAYRAWVAKAIQEDGANLDSVRGERPAIPLEHAHEHSIGEHVAEMRASVTRRSLSSNRCGRRTSIAPLRSACSAPSR